MFVERSDVVLCFVRVYMCNYMAVLMSFKRVGETRWRELTTMPLMSIASIVAFAICV